MSQNKMAAILDGAGVVPSLLHGDLFDINMGITGNNPSKCRFIVTRRPVVTEQLVRKFIDLNLQYVALVIWFHMIHIHVR